MNWENTDFSFEEEKETASSQNRTSTEGMSTEEEDDKSIQLKKFQNPHTNIDRQAFIAIANKFGELLINDQTHEIADNLLTEDCHSYLFNFTAAGATYSVGNQGFLTLYKGCLIIERKVRETYVDVAKNAVFQVCECKILDQDGVAIEQLSCEFFTFQDLKIVRYRAAFGFKTDVHGPDDLFGKTSKDIMLAKVKELNYAFSDQPDLEEIASLLQDNTEYKMWDWDGQKCHTFHKQEFVHGWKNLEEHYTLKCIVPYEVYSERQFIVGTYVYYLESKAEPGKEYAWLSTSVYSFDKNLNITQVNQQGELYPTEEAEVPFQVISRQKLENKVQELLKHLKAGEELFYSADVDFGCVITRFGPPNNPFAGTFQGLKQIEKLNSHVCSGGGNFEWCKLVDVYVDHQDPSYDVAIAIACNQGTICNADYRYNGRKINLFVINKYSFENGKLAKICQFFCEIPDPMISPYDNPEFEGVNIIPRNYII